MATQLQLRRGLSSEWASSNPILAQGELAVELDTHQFKIGDGITHWNLLSYGGLQGPAGTNTDIIVYSSIDISTNKVIAVVNGSVVYADSSNVNHAGSVIGISSNSASAGNPITVKTVGELSGFALLTPGKMYLSTNGNFSTTMPSTGFIQSLGVIITSSSLVIKIGDPIILSS